MDRALEFYRGGLLGMDVLFDQTMAGEPFDHALGGGDGNQGRVVGGVIGGVTIELLSLGTASRPAKRSFIGNQNISLSVTDLDLTYRQVQAAASRRIRLRSTSPEFGCSSSGILTEHQWNSSSSRVLHAHRRSYIVVSPPDATYWHPGSLSGHRVIVTGGAARGGVGRGISAALLERGASVLLVIVRTD